MFICKIEGLRGCNQLGNARFVQMILAESEKRQDSTGQINTKGRYLLAEGNLRSSAQKGKFRGSNLANIVKREVLCRCRS
jgi:hypothetical protein